MHYFPMTLANLINNKVQDLKNPSVYGTLPIIASSIQDKDNHNFFNFEANYAYEDLNPGRYINTYTINQTKVGIYYI